MNEKTLRLLEYDEIRRRLARCALSEEAASLILERGPCADPAEVKRLKALTAAALDRMENASGGPEPRHRLPPAAFIFPKLDLEGAVLGVEEAYALGLFVERGSALKQWFAGGKGMDAGGPGFPEELLSAIPDCSAVSREVFGVLDREGKLLDLPEFRAIRKRIRRLTEDLEAAVSRYTGNEETRRMLQSAVPSQRDGRVVLALRANFRGRIRGIVHEVSSTGQTIFVEPEEVVERNNDILIEQRRLDAEIRRVLRELSARVAVHREALAVFHRGVLELELIRCRARYSLETRGRFAEDRDELVLRQARHPLLDQAVPIDLVMGGTRIVIITGPNTGGKTVALKTVGLLALMNQSGLAVPAEEGTALPLFDGVYADIGDEQSISQSLSTFSAHMTNIAGILDQAGGASLVLLDELGSGTDPEEGSAIAMAILDHAVENNFRLIATTHHGILKNYGYTRRGVENASVEFNRETLSPTYRIIMGVPGESRALDIAGRNGLPGRVMERARSYLDEERADVSALIGSLKEKHRELDAAVERGRAEETRLREDRRRADLKELRIRQKEAEIKAGAAGKLRGLLEESRKTLENLVRELREGELNRDKTLAVKKFLGDLAATVEAEDAALEEERRLLAEDARRLEETFAGEQGRGAAAETAAAAGPLAPGTEVLAGPSRRRGILRRRDRRGRWVVEIGSLRMSFFEEELVPLPPASIPFPPAAPPRQPQISVSALSAAQDAGPEINLRGMRLEEALEALRRQIDGAVLAGLHTFAVIHGKGDGVLQKAVHEYLRNEQAVADYYFSRPELGGFGRTEVVLKDS
ncbi:MAG: Smr/MutS family protein [Treponema sp.]|jgi:DNA mismatch repair protein MutS2|nr:Smr/MutS family protein [Treponema sp.]